VGVTRHKGLDKVILKDFSELPEDVDYGDFGVVNVSPSIVPAYFPSFRIFNYNISAEAVQGALERRERRRRGETLGKKPPHGHRKPDPTKPRADQCKKKEYRYSWRCHFSKDDWHSDPEAPSRKNGLMSPLGYAQVSLGPFDIFAVAVSFAWCASLAGSFPSDVVPTSVDRFPPLPAVGAFDGTRLLMALAPSPLSPLLP